MQNEKEISFLDGFNVLLGPNFIGKTSILEAIQYVFTGNMPAYKSKEKEKNWISAGSSRADVELFFEHEQNQYIIRRSIKSRTSKSDVTEELLLLDEGKEVSIARGKDVDTKVTQFLPYDKYSLNKVAFISDDIVNEINSGQKDLFKALKEVLSFNELQTYSLKLKSDLSSLMRDKENLEKKILELSSQSGDLNKELADLEKQLVTHEREVNSKQKAMESKKKEKDRITEGKSKQEAIEQKNAQLDSFKKEIDLQPGEDFDKVISTLKGQFEQLDKDFLSLKEDYDRKKGRHEILHQILEVLQSSEEEECPVCNKIILPDEKIELLELHTKAQENNEKGQAERLKEIEIKQLSKKEIQKRIEKLINQKIMLERLTNELQLLSQGYNSSLDFKSQYEPAKEALQKAEEELKQALKVQNEAKVKILQIQANLELQSSKLPEQLKAVTKEYHKKNLMKDVLDKTENDFILDMIGSIKTDLEIIWLKVQSEALEVDVGDQKGLNIKFNRKNKELKIIEMSGSERKMLILLIAMLLNKKFFSYPIVTIDEPFEPLDEINDEKLIGSFLELAKDGQIICTKVKDANSKVLGEKFGEQLNLLDLEEIWK